MAARSSSLRMHRGRSKGKRGRHFHHQHHEREFSNHREEEEARLWWWLEFGLGAGLFGMLAACGFLIVWKFSMRRHASNQPQWIQDAQSMEMPSFHWPGKPPPPPMTMPPPGPPDRSELAAPPSPAPV